MRLVIFLMSILISLSGCVTLHEDFIVDVIKPESPFVTINVKQKTAGQSIIYNYYADDYDCYGLKSNPPPLVFDTKLQSISVKHRNFYTFTYIYSNYTYPVVTNCGGVYTFPIKTGYDYEIQTEKNSNMCSVVVLERKADKPSLNWHAITAFPRATTHPSTNVEGPWCRADRLYSGSSELVVPRATDQRR